MLTAGIWSGWQWISRSLVRSVTHRPPGEELRLPDDGPLASFAGATGWLNSDPLTPEGLRGRVVLVDFWTYTCVNWLRTLPYRRAWAAKYAAHGLTIVGVHTPEFAFEHDLDNVTTHSRALGVEYPIAIDSDYGVWRAFANHFWPALYLADAQGRIRYHHFGEGEYAMSEMAIQQLLTDAGATGLRSEPGDGRPTGPRGGRRLGEPAVARDVRRLRPGDRLRVAWCRVGCAARLRAGPAATQSMGALGHVDRRPTCWAAERARRQDRVPLSRTRRQPGDGTGLTRSNRSLSASRSTASRPPTLTEPTSTPTAAGSSMRSAPTS